jgi:hypothetical protein
VTDWVARHRSSISFVVITTTGVAVILAGLFVYGGDMAMIALGAGAIGLPGTISVVASSPAAPVDEGTT